MTDYSDEQIAALIKRLQYAGMPDAMTGYIASHQYLYSEAADALASLQRRNAELLREMMGWREACLADDEASKLASLQQAKREVLALCDRRALRTSAQRRKAVVAVEEIRAIYKQKESQDA